MDPYARSRQTHVGHRSAFFAAFAVFMIAAIAILSFLPGESKQMLHTHGRFHSWGHLLAFSVIGFVVAMASRSPRGRMLFFFGSLVFGLTIEVAEHIVFKSAIEWKDVLVDASGVVGGTLLAIASTEEPGSTGPTPQ